MDAAALKRIDRERYVSLVTFRKTGRAVPTPVWFALAEGRFHVFSESKAGKMKRLRNNPRIQLAACDVRGKVHGEFMDGRATHTEDPETIARAYTALRSKYGWQMKLADFFSRLSGRYDQRAMLEIELDEPVSGG